jgi:DNA-binding NarL/FixJ family response regulator
MAKPAASNTAPASLLHSRATQELLALTETFDSLLSSGALSPSLRDQLRRIRIEISHLAILARDELYSVESELEVEDVKSPHRAELQISLRSLTATEYEILNAIATGATTYEIARKRHNSEATVKSHLTSIYRKLSVRNRVEAVALLKS